MSLTQILVVLTTLMISLLKECAVFVTEESLIMSKSAPTPTVDLETLGVTTVPGTMKILKDAVIMILIHSKQLQCAVVAKVVVLMQLLEELTQPEMAVIGITDIQKLVENITPLPSRPKRDAALAEVVSKV
jgi:hypothetical protein